MFSLLQRYNSSIIFRILLQKIAVGIIITVILISILVQKNDLNDLMRDSIELILCLTIQISLGQWLLWRAVFKPIGVIKEAMRHRALGDKTVFAPVFHEDEIGSVARSLNEMLNTVSASEARLQAVLSTVIDGIITVDATGTIHGFTAAAEKIFGYEAREVIGRNLDMLIPHNSADPHDDYLAEYIRTGNDKIIGINRVVTARRKNGEKFPMELAINQADLGNSCIFVGIVRDVTERQERENQVFTYAQQLEGKTLELEHVTQMKSEFLANMSHEIRTPMNGIIGMTELLLETPLAAKQKHYAETVLHSAESLLILINDILDLSKVESGKMELEPVIFDMQKLAHEVIDLLSIKAQEKAIALAMTYASDATHYVVGDQVRVRQILSNLVSNAIKFTKKGQVLLAIEPNLEREDEVGMADFLIKVSDTGIGISENAQQHVFDKFTQADASTTRKYGGTGLGLAICKELVGMMNGKIGLTSELDKGSTFWFTLKLRRAAAPALTESSCTNQQHLIAGDVQFQNVHILLAEDNHIDQEYALEMLRSMGCRVSLAENGETVLHKVIEQKFDMILMDCEMPEMSGYRAAHILTARKNSGDYPDIPIVALISSNEVEVHSRCLISGMVDSLAKPLRKESLAQMLLAWLPKDRVVSTANKTAQNNLIGRHILLVEDSAVNQMFIKETLLQIGCRVTIAENGLEAITVAQAENDINMILMDGHMPIMDGFEATRTIRNLQKSGTIHQMPVIALTAMAMSGDRERCLEAGMDDYLAKPVRKDALVAMLLKWLEKDNATAKSVTRSASDTGANTITLVDVGVKDQMRSELGQKYGRFLQTYLDDTETRLKNIGDILSADADAKKITLHAHSISSSSAYAGAMRLSNLASTLEQKAGKEGADIMTIATLHTAMRQSFAETRQMLESG
jgi:PAS domain S-box-containing protein